VGALTNLTHTKCFKCGAINCQEIEWPDEYGEEDEEGVINDQTKRD
jgi:hypothetical protein